MSEKILIVEGETDKKLLQSILARGNIKGVEIFPPRNISEGTGNGVNNAIDVLRLTLKQTKSGKHKNIGIILDSDHPENNGGFHSRRKALCDAFSDAGFTHSLSLGQIKHQGEIMTHPKLPGKCGFWLMPNHGNDGISESLLKLSVDSTQLNLLKYAESSVQNIETPLFSKYHLDKAVVATWLAWQKWAGMPIEKAIERDLIDLSTGHFSPLMKWLQEISSP